MSRKILYILNPVAGTRSKTNLQRIIEEKTKKAGIPFLAYSSVAGGDYSFLHSIIKEEHVSDVVIAGGDGTVSQVVGSLVNENVNFGIIPCGSGNGLALALKIPKQPQKALEIIFNGKASPIDGFAVNNRFACMLAGLGFDAKVASDFTKAPKRGLLTYIKLSLKNFFFMKPHRFELKTENVSLATDAFFISIANSNQFGNNFTIAPRASLCDGLLDVIIVTGQNKVSAVLQILRQLAGWNRLLASALVRSKKGVIYFQADRLDITNLSGALLHIDGEPAETSRQLSIKVMPACFRLIQPA
jgi:YegS/Rv2252/BmrU family lipid kinase